MRCPSCHLAVTDSEFLSGVCPVCSHSLPQIPIASAASAPATEEKSPLWSNLILIGGIVVILAALTAGIVFMSRETNEGLPAANRDTKKRDEPAAPTAKPLKQTQAAPTKGPELPVIKVMPELVRRAAP